MPKYAKFLKVLLSNKARLEEACTVTMNERCSAVLLNKLPFKEKDPGSFTIPCDIRHLHIDNALADLGASISLMPYTMYEKLGLGEPKPTRMSLELADRSIQYPRGIAEDVLIKIDKFVLPIDFVILDMREDSRIRIILGRPFLATARAMIDVFNKKITLRVRSEESYNQQPKNDWKMTTWIMTSIDPILKNRGPNSEIPIWRIDHINTPYPQETQEQEEKLSKHLYSASAIEIDGKKPELKDLPSHLYYAYLKGDETCLVIISSKLTEKGKTSLLRVLEKRNRAIAWKMLDIKGISPSFCTCKILMEESFKPVIQPQRRLNLKVQDVVKDEIFRLLDSELIYHILDSPWVSPTHVVPKKRGMTVVLNDNNELIPSQTVTGWRVYIDYRFFQIPITPEDQEKTTFTCPYETFAYRRMPFGLCNTSVVTPPKSGRSGKEWHDGSSSRNIGDNNSTNRLAGIVSKIDNLGRDMKKLKENVHAIQVGCQICEGPHLDKEYPLNKEVKGVEEVKTTTEAPSSSTGQCKAFITDNKAPLKPTFSKVHGVSFLSDTNLQIVKEEDVEQTKVLSCQLPPKELNPGSFTPPCTIGKLIFYAMADLGASVNVLPRGIYEYLKLTNLMRTDMLVEMADMTKKAPLGIIENILVRIDKFLFPSDFVIIDKTPNETIILGRPFLATIHAEINVFVREISLGISDDRVIFYMEKKDHNFTIPTGKILMVKSIRNDMPPYSTTSNPSLNLDNKKTNNLHDRVCDVQEQQIKKKIRLDENIPVKLFCKPVKQEYNGTFRMWPSCDPTKKICDGGHEQYGLIDDLIWDQRYAEWCCENSLSEPSSSKTIPLDSKPMPRDYTFKEWVLIKVEHTDVNESVKEALLKSWIIDCFEGELGPDKNLTERSFDNYKWVFDLKIDKLADEYELGIRKKGHILDEVWEGCKKVQGKDEVEKEPKEKRRMDVLAARRGIEFAQNSIVKSSLLAIVISRPGATLRGVSF
ncbi:DNA-directed DNA polymerase [Tanacetum coccineum]|uniref:DNA-directed DNA polymerase n=1 Tax=Tanacetum coccineum TaxID=301880 RepID=A0ABQ5FWW7_9ASTR